MRCRATAPFARRAVLDRVREKRIDLLRSLQARPLVPHGAERTLDNFRSGGGGVREILAYLIRDCRVTCAEESFEGAQVAQW